MPKYTVTYFDSPGRAQTTRHMLVNAGIEFEDKRVGGESWMAIKPSAPLKQLPILDVEGMDTICQSPAIERYVASVCGYMGSNATEACLIDQIHTSSGELASFAIPYFFGDISKDEEKKEEFRKGLMEKLPTWFAFLNARLETNGGGDGFFVGSTPSLADFFWANMCGFIAPLDKEGTLQAAYPKLFALSARVLALPAIKEFDAKHQK